MSSTVMAISLRLSSVRLIGSEKEITIAVFLGFSTAFPGATVISGRSNTSGSIVIGSAALKIVAVVFSFSALSKETLSAGVAIHLAN